MQPDTNPNNRQNQIWGEAQNPALQQQFQSPQQQVIILNPKYRPELNLRLISTGILVLGIAISIALRGACGWAHTRRILYNRSREWYAPGW